MASAILSVRQSLDDTISQTRRASGRSGMVVSGATSLDLRLRLPLPATAKKNLLSTKPTRWRVGDVCVVTMYFAPLSH